jgi:MoaA/NifB/PqqE/SkfB family radical SAM enzyme
MKGSPRRRDYLPTDWVLDALASSPELGVGSVFLTGGEPLLHPYFGDILRTAAARTDATVTVCTNATRLKVRDASTFAALNTHAHVSIDGTAAFHDRFRNTRGSFIEAERGITLLVNAGVPVTIVTTVSQENLELFPEVAEWAVARGATRLLVQPLLALGRGVDIAGQQLTSSQLNRLILTVSDLANSIGRGGIAATMIGANRAFLLAHPCAAYVCNGQACHRGVEAEIKKLVVRETGHILPEATNLDHRFAIGTVRDGPLADQVRAYFEHGYNAFDQLCRKAYRLVADWPDALVPWDEILANESAFGPGPSRCLETTGAGACETDVRASRLGLPRAARANG